ncbi:MAG: oxaloacetate decarboxylase [Clostridia bacterium]|nr:oxaloacetate decarboxylase [Clostridia bacterium]
MQFVPMNFISNMRYMGLGMLGIFVVIGIIAGVTVLLNRFTSVKK